MTRDEMLTDMYRILKRLEVHLGAAPKPAGAVSGSSGGAVASDSDLDSEWGDVEIKKDPKRWDGQSYVGYRYSQTTPEYLDTLASFLDWKAGKDEEGASSPPPGKTREDLLKYAGYARKDAARARGWAARLRNGHAPAAAAPPPMSADDYSIPF